MTRSLWITMAIALALVSLPREADACGGTFCDVGPTSMPVDQTGENILFVMGGSYTEAHIQIQYDPETTAETFAWVVPIQLVPEFTVGSQALFTNMLAGTVPAYGFSYQFDSCRDPSTTAMTSSGSSNDTDPSGGPEVLLEQTVGAFDITVLSGGTAEEVMTWLGENGYEQDPDAEPILAEYLAENYLFAAFKLTQGADTAEIHPIALRFEQDEACVPLRLTRIAAQEDMEVRTFFLASDRVVPQNYKHVLVNPLKLDWPNLAANYKDVITLAVDAFGADGKAFVTEYAGTSAVVNTFGIHDQAWNAAVFDGLSPALVIDRLEEQGLVFRNEFDEPSVTFVHALIEGLLAQHLPPPDGVAADDFYFCLSCYEDMIDVATWAEGAPFAAAMQERIVAPGLHAQEVLQQFPTLTRMYTTISPAEMTEDPFFWVNPALPDVDLTNAVATRRVLCNTDVVWTLPDGKEVYVQNDGPWPAFGEEMPYEEEVQEIPQNGAPIMIVDNRGSITAQLDAYNCSQGWPANECGGAGTGSGSATGVDTSGESSASGGQDDDDAGCGCTSGSGSGAFALLGIAAFVRRRRR
jgi:MYXO-CTERM domain-containing protein